MIDVTSNWWVALYFTIPLGLIGGFAYELLQARAKGETGWFELPNSPKKRFVDLGVVSSMLIGAIAATVFLIVYPPSETEVVTEGVNSVTRAYSGIGLVAISLAVGAAGSSVLGAFTRAFTKAAEAVNLETILTSLKDLKAKADEAAEAATTDPTRLEVKSDIARLIRQVESMQER